MKKTVKIEYLIDVEFDPESAQFKQAFDDFKSSIDHTATVDSFVQHVVWSANRFGGERMIEGAGYVQVGSEKVKDEALFCGITIDDDRPDADIDYF